MDENWVQVYSETFQPKAELVKSFLIENGVNALILNQRDSAHGTFGEILIMVPKEQFLKATNLIKQIGE